MTNFKMVITGICFVNTHLGIYRSCNDNNEKKLKSNKCTFWLQNMSVEYLH